ncbi:MAG: YIP1 family protein [Actinomycetota bacterium]|nr:YIP1 family protein [Actinomycetota bacterium]
MFLGVLRNPRATLEATGRERRFWAAARIVGLWALLNFLLTEAFVLGRDLREQFPELSPATLEQLDATLRIFAPASAVLLPFIWWIGVSFLLQITPRLFGGRTDLAPTLAVVGASCAPWVLGYAIQLPLGILQLLLVGSGGAAALGVLAFLISIGSLVWHVVLVIIGTRLVAGTSYRGAGASCALTGLGCATAGLILMISVLTLIFTLSGVAGG